MLSYQHGYHAGNFADVIKHLALTQLLSYLTLKDKPLFYLETHSGTGVYHLKSKQSEKTGEYKQGINLIWPQRAKLPVEFQNYLNIIKELNQTDELNYYPGSPVLAINSLRPEDRLFFCELHPNEFELLKQISTYKKKVHFSHSDGVAQLKALLPPPEKRGLIFIDPSYEIKEEYKKIPQAIKNAYAHFSNGVYCLWYPLVDRKFTEQLSKKMQEIEAKNILKVEFNLNLYPNEGMAGCGLWIINPPFTFAAEMETILNILKTYFNPGKSSYIIEY